MTSEPGLPLPSPERGARRALARLDRSPSRASAAIVLPAPVVGPVRAVLQRVLIAASVLTAVALLVWLDRDGYTDNSDREVDLLDAFYYATVTLSTTGYGDITPVADRARLVNVMVITPLRIMFLIILVGTTLEVLTQRTREQLRQNRWRSSLREHTVVVGYGTKGRSAVRALLDDGEDRAHIVVVDNDPDHITDASDDGIAAINGDGTRADVLRRADIEHARRVIVAVPRDDAAVLVTLTVRRHNPTAYVVAAVRESENAPLLRDGGANGVVVSSEAAGRLLGVAASSPSTGAIFEDLLVPGQGLELAERDVLREEVGLPPRACNDLIVAIIRDGQTQMFHAEQNLKLRRSDRVVVVRPAADEHVPDVHT
ncbi:MAG: Potassium channel protein [uncultured Frankineae bacterium]|uniref:Potassium channel protein n=1 Tax=uncultured Frankineae bacterium TaxID=437475 RepID=A0A6J4LGS7_9ACTN|nr:MAG: Potassium channel protein [uncultured Frankineae bacterium]